MLVWQQSTRHDSNIAHGCLQHAANSNAYTNSGWCRSRECCVVFHWRPTLTCRDADAIDSLDRYSMACPALPLCGLAIAEAERGLPDINNRIRVLMDKLGFGPDEHFHVRMTGCPNGCTRPYMAELGFVGDGPNSYQLWLGGTAAQTRLAEPFMERMKVQVGC